MGEYWHPVNVDRGEAIHPHQVGCGLKRGEWYYAGSAVMRCIQKLLEDGRWSETDEIRAVSDYGGAFHIRGPVTTRVAREEPDETGVDVGEPGFSDTHQGYYAQFPTVRIERHNYFPEAQGLPEYRGELFPEVPGDA